MANKTPKQKNKKTIDLHEHKEAMVRKERYEIALSKSAKIFYDWKPWEEKAIFTGNALGVLGYSNEEIAGKWFDLIHPHDYDRFQEELQECIERSASFTLRYRMRHKNGYYVFVRDDGFMLLDKNGKVDRMIGFVTDITKEVLEIEKLRMREKRYRELVESQQELIARLDVEEKFSFLNDAYCKKFGKSRKELYGTKFVQFVHEEDLESVLDAMKGLEAPPYRVFFEHRAHTAHGWRWIAWEHFAIKNDEGSTVEIQAIGRDVTERRHAVEKLRKRTKDLEVAKSQLEADNAKDEALLSSIGDGIIATDRSCIITHINEAAVDMFGYLRDDLVGRYVHDVVKMENALGNPIENQKRPSFLALSSGKKTIAMRYYYVRADGSKFPAEITVTPVILNKRIMGTIEVFRDITREMEIDKAKTEFVSLASHQLRTPLSIVTWYAEALLRNYTGTLTNEQRDYVREINLATKRMISLVNDFLNVSRIELGTFTVQKQRVHLPEIAHSILAELEKFIEQKSITIERYYDFMMPHIYSDPHHLRIILQNLITNAVKYTSEGGKVGVAIEQDKTAIEIKISDTGWGIPVSQQSKIFTKLFRADNVKEKDTDGTGLGLYIVRSILNQFKGKIWFESEEEKGTTFFVRIPIEDITDENMGV